MKKPAHRTRLHGRRAGHGVFPPVRRGFGCASRSRSFHLSGEPRRRAERYELAGRMGVFVDGLLRCFQRPQA